VSREDKGGVEDATDRHLEKSIADCSGRWERGGGCSWNIHKSARDNNAGQDGMPVKG